MRKLLEEDASLNEQITEKIKAAFQSGDNAALENYKASAETEDDMESDMEDEDDFDIKVMDIEGE